MDRNHPVLSWMGKRGWLPFGGSNKMDGSLLAYRRRLLKDVKNRAPISTKLTDMPFVVLDIETTGFRYGQGDEIISIGAMAMQKKCALHEQELFHSYVKPLQVIPQVITDLTGITEKDVAEAPGLEQAMKSLLAIVHGKTIVAYGAQHDMGFLQLATSKYWGIKIQNRVIDAYRVAKWLHPEWSEHTLDRALHHYDIPIRGRHTADGDTRMTAYLWQKWLGEMEKRKLDTLEDLYLALSRVR
ncbi:3'-5' exonuclease [Hazenella sp. IB182357]|uniref:3'-5' exonuclease n=1 Tax=Polycladospora coralii TaxID=2771432 RepID=A0A926RVT0_9BACL|nr:exonuclease domain-containing protein [Polycladospora coralii]MBD1373919.1 3'-5' exonuclease [Polycladospora coralii]